MSNHFSFKATMSVAGLPVTLLGDRVCTTRNRAQPTLFEFQVYEDDCYLTVGDKFVSMNSDGYICVDNVGEFFAINPSRGRVLVSDSLPQGKFEVSLTSKELGAPVILYGYGESFDDERIYDFLIAARKVGRMNRHRDIDYYVPTGDGSWIKYPENKPYNVTPVQITLEVQSS